MADKAQNWEVVPHLVRDWYILVKPQADEAVKMAGNEDKVTVPCPNGDGYDIVIPLKKTANSLVWPAKLYGWLQKPFGGPHPLAASLVGAALGAAGGYGAGRLASWALPDDYVDKKGIKRLGLYGGALAGAGLPSLLYTLPMVQLHGPQGALMSGGPFGPEEGNFLERTFDFGKGASKTAEDDTLTRAVRRAEEQWGIKVAAFDSAFQRLSQGVAGAVAPTVPVDSLNRVIITDPYLSAPEKALFAGVGEAAAARKGRRFVSPADLMHVAANVGIGALGGGVLGGLGRMVGVLGPQGVKGMQNVGMIAGIARSLFG